MTGGRFLVRLELQVRDSGGYRLGYLYPAKRFADGQRAEQFGMCLWSTRHRDAVAVHVFPPVGDRRLAADGWSIAEPIHMDCGELSRQVVPAVTVVPAGSVCGRSGGAAGAESAAVAESADAYVAQTDPAPAGAPGPDRTAACYSVACSAATP